MALTDKAYVAVHDKTGGDLVELKDEFDAGYLTKIADVPSKEPALTALVYQIGLLQDELDYLRTEISANKNKASFPGFGNKNIQALAGNTTTISSSQASAITANTAKTSMSLGTSGTTALAGDTNIVTIGSSTTIAFGDMVTVPPKGKTPASYNIVMTVTNGGVSKSTTLTLT